MSLSKNIRETALFWSQSETFDLATRQEIQNLFDSHNDTELTNRFYKDLEFGTGGMRGLMGAGIARFNTYNVRRATQALALYLREIHGNKDVKIALSYDSRINSRLYAEEACAVLAEHKIHCMITHEMRPVPMLSFMVRHFACDAGICITASHNPAAYNGYKIYWKSGGQLSSPHDKKIFEYYKKLNDYTQLSSASFEKAKTSGFVKEIADELDTAYFKKLKLLSFFEGHRDLKIVYSPLHGTGIYAVPQALAEFGFHNTSIVEEQSKPDGLFPTVKSPNPEDSSSLEMAMKLGRSLNADIVLATDPDADRLAVVVRENNEWKMFSGNQMGALLFNYVLSMSKLQNRLPSDGFTIKTIVTSELLRKISNHYGLPCEDTLTGFKWICDLVEDYESGKIKPHKTFICGAEESYGFLADSFVRDKDAILSSVIATEMLAYYKNQNKTLSEVLDELYLLHGVYHEHLETLTLPGKEGDEKIRNIMNQLRKNTPKTIAGFPVQLVKDYLEPERTSLPVSDVLQFFCDGALISVRPSGTEPKIKIYLSTFEPTQNIFQSQLSGIKIKAEKKTESLLTSFLAILNSF